MSLRGFVAVVAIVAIVGLSETFERCHFDSFLVAVAVVAAVDIAVFAVVEFLGQWSHHQ